MTRQEAQNNLMKREDNMTLGKKLRKLRGSKTRGRSENMEALLINVGTMVAIVGIAFSVTVISMIALAALDSAGRWFG